jgi:hypothetical protein
MTLLALAHLLLFVYWLGADLGVFYSSRFVADASRGAKERLLAAQIMLGIDLVPRLCMPLVLATGAQLAAAKGMLLLSPLMQAAVWLLAAAWLASVVVLHHHRPSWLVALDRAVRVMVVVGLVSVVSDGWLYGRWGIAPWLAFKLLCFATTVGCGLMIRVRLAPFGPAFTRLATGQPEVGDDAIISRSIARCRPWVVLIWVVLVLAAATGRHWLPLG